ncbi:MAG: 3-deoxy-7-phosphoheptulonate synthase [Alphaproteobacteria bacterium]|nr:3-deoxy-7-phosphoheptulonate synthase [Alphaproteobacteria bacterium]MCB9698557.1 3-deoxy-7-phosphoheptulonate synthase [Alphaproteobacteria bacterium]
MLVVMRHDSTPAEVEAVCERITSLGLTARPMPGGERVAVGVLGNHGPVDPARFHGMPGVAEAIPVSAPYKQVSREWRHDQTLIRLDNGVTIGGPEVVVMGGPCAVESEDQLMRTAERVREAGGTVLRGGAFKPRTSPYAFQGLGLEGLKLLAKARERTGLAVITEAIDEESARMVADHADIVQLGARNMQNYALLKVVGTLGRPVMLKRGLSATISEWLLAAEYLLDAGLHDVMLCERGIRSFDAATRNVLDVGAIALARNLTHLPVVADPSHATGRRELVAPAARAAVAAGADAVIVETHPEPAKALSDGQQALLPDDFATMVRQLRAIAASIDRPLATLP